MKLYDAVPSGNCHKVRLLLSMLGLEHETVAIDLRAGEHRQPPFLAINPRGQVPVLEDGGRHIWDSQAILAYLARRYGGDDWLPLDPELMAEVMQWLAVAADEISTGLSRARLFKKFGAPGNLERAQEISGKALALLQEGLRDRDWLAAGRPTIADLACFPYVGLAHEGGVEIGDYPAVVAWVARVKALPGYVTMPGL